MPYFFGHTHTKRDRRGSGLADRDGIPEPHHVWEDSLEVTSGGPTGRGAPTPGAIAELAYSYWEARGYQGGSDWEDWFRAERELEERDER